MPISLKSDGLVLEYQMKMNGDVVYQNSILGVVWSIGSYKFRLNSLLSTERDWQLDEAVVGCG